MKFRNILALTGLTGGVSYFAYRKISDELFKTAFVKREKVTLVEQRYLDWLAQSNSQELNIASFDGLNLCGIEINNHETDDYVVMVHGIWSDKSSMYERAYEFDKRGYNLLLIDQRSCGESEGEYYTYGQKEAIDLIEWISILIEKHPDAKIALYGVSTGASAVMMSCAYDLPDNVRCLIEDCGFSSAEEEFDHVLKNNYRLAYTKIVLLMLEKKMKKELGLSLDDISPKKSLDENEIPIMFIHGTDDELVPFEMSKVLYNHNKGIRKYYPVTGASHTEANKDPEYYNHLDHFIRDHFV